MSKKTNLAIVLGVLLSVMGGILIIISIRHITKLYLAFFIEYLTLIIPIIFIVITVGLFIFTSRKRKEILRYKEEINDFRGWDEKESTFRIVGNIRRLNKKGVTKIDLFDCYLVNARLDHANLQGAHLTRASLQGANLGYSNLQGAHLEEANLQGAHLEGANLQEAHLEGANLQEAELLDAYLQGAHLTRASLQGANLYGSNLQESDLTRADLNDAILQDANLKRAGLYGAQLTNACLTDAILQDADLKGSNLQGADLLNTNIAGADLSYSDLRNAKYLDHHQLSQAKSLYGAKIYPKIEGKIKEKYPHLLEKPKEEE